MARHVGIGDARVIVGFSALGGHVGEVELGPGPEYFVTLGAHYQDDPRDIPAVLAHEVTHVFLHRHGLRHADLARHEILTDTAALYLGVGYLSPPEMGYVLAKRALAIGEEVRPFSGAAAEAYRLGHTRALADYVRPPLSGASRAARARYRRDRELSRSAADYHFAGGKVAFACPACGHGTRLPAGRSVRARCAVCRSVFACET